LYVDEELRVNDENASGVDAILPRDIGTLSLLLTITSALSELRLQRQVKLHVAIR
jgi:hypothetical protein